MRGTIAATMAVLRAGTAILRAGTAVLLAGAALPAVAADAPPVPATGTAAAFHVGKLELVAVQDNLFNAPNDGKTFGVDVGPAAVGKLLTQAGKPAERITVGVDALLVRLPGRVLLIDTGLGSKAGGVLIASLGKAGVAPGAVTDVLITHSHGDHVGGLVTADGQLAFPNATIRMAADEWTFLQANKGAHDLVQVIAPKVATFQPGAVIAPGVTSVMIAGHTPGHVGYEIRSGGTMLLDIGDTAHSSVVSLMRPEWIMGFDSDPAVGRASRIALLKSLSASHELIFSPHFPFPGVGRVVAAGDGFAWQPDLPR